MRKDYLIAHTVIIPYSNCELRVRFTKMWSLPDIHEKDKAMEEIWLDVGHLRAKLNPSVHGFKPDGQIYYHTGHSTMRTKNVRWWESPKRADALLREEALIYSKVLKQEGWEMVDTFTAMVEKI